MSEKLTEWNTPHGMIASGFTPSPRELIQVLTVQTLHRRLGTISPFDFLLFDEAHHCCAASYIEILAAHPEAWVVGVTATPSRLDWRGLGRVFGSLICGPTVAELTEAGYLVPALVYTPDAVDMSGLHTKMGEYVTAEAEERINKPSITGSAVDHYRRITPGKRAIAFCISIKHSQDVAAEFSASGIPAAHIDGTMDRHVLGGILGKFGRGEILVLTNCALVSEGFDVPAVEVCIMLRPTLSLALYLQMVGRVLRPSPGKTQAVIFDHVKNSFYNLDGDLRAKHGFPDDDREWSLEGGVKKRAKSAEEIALPFKRCPKCSATYKPFVTKCTAQLPPDSHICGYVFESVGRSEIERVEGELKPITHDDVGKSPQQRKKIVDLPVILARNQGREALDAIARERGYKPGWVDHQMKFAKPRAGRPDLDPGYWEAIEKDAR